MYKPIKVRSNYKIPSKLIGPLLNGKRLMYKVGKSLRKRYQKLLPQYDQEVVQFSSTVITRTKMSASCVAAGVFPTDKTTLEDTTTWPPVPVNQNTLYDKHEIFSQNKDEKPCPRYAAMRDQIKLQEKSQTPKIRRKSYEELNSCISRTYHKNHFANTLQEHTMASDTFLAWILNDKEVPQWIYLMMPVMKKVKQMRLWSLIHGKPNMLRYFTGPMYWQIQSEMEAAMVAGDEGDRRTRFHFHGSHDSTLEAVLWGLSRDETYPVNLGDTLLVELTADSTVKVYLYVPLAVEKSKRFSPVSLEPLCGKVGCSLTEFKEALKELTLDEDQWQALCKDDSPLDNQYRVFPQEVNQEDLETVKKAQKLC